jgi:phospholipase B1, membrane-associated
MFSASFVVSFIFLTVITNVAFSHPFKEDDTEFVKGLERLQKSQHLRYYPWMTGTGRQMALLDAMYSDPVYRKAMREEPEKYGLGCCGNKTQLDPFPCKPFTRKTERSDSVHALTPADIDIVAAIGDSLTSGTGVDACTVLGLLVEYRGRVFSIGGDDNVKDNPTLANMLRLYNPNLTGFSFGRGSYTGKKSHLNVAHPGDNSMQLMFQSQLLVQRMHEELTEEQFKNGWKLVTIFIGNNDICDFCEEAEGLFTPEVFLQRLQTALDYLHVNLPRTLVNVVTLVDTVLAQQLNQGGLVCKTLHYFTCKCAAFAKDPASVKIFNDAYQAAAHRVVEDGRYDNDPQFTVVIQPFFQDTTLPLKEDGSIDYSFFAPDCFHFSAKGHAATAQALWNSMFEAVGKKKTYWEIFEPFECPDTENPYIRTAKN